MQRDPYYKWDYYALNGIMVQAFQNLVITATLAWV